jgi:hypothetical protein
MKLEEQKIIGYQIIDGKEVPVINCPTEVTIKNKVTGVIYESEEQAKADIENPNTPTTEEHIQRDVKITVARLDIFGSTQ